MKKIVIIISGFLLFTLLSLPVHAAEGAQISEGYTSDGVHYTVYTIDPSPNTTLAIGDTLNVQREFHYAGIITPPSQVTWTEIHNGITYTGTLKLYNFSFKNGNTIACYKGTIIAIE